MKRRFPSNVLNVDNSIEPQDAGSRQARGSETDPIEIHSDDESDDPVSSQRLAHRQSSSLIKAEVEDEVIHDVDAEPRTPDTEPATEQIRVGTQDAPDPNAAETANPTIAFHEGATSRFAADKPKDPIGPAVFYPASALHPSPAGPLHQDRSRTTVSTLDPNLIHLNACGMIIYNVAGRRWTMTGCSLCGANWTYRKLGYFGDLMSLYRHIAKAHEEARSDYLSGSGSTAILDKYAYGSDVTLDEDEALLLSLNPNLVPANFHGRFVGAIDTDDMPGFTKQNELRRKLKAVIETYCPRVKGPSDESEPLPARRDRLRSRSGAHADGNDNEVSRRTRTHVASDEEPIPATNLPEEDAAQGALISSLIPQEKMRNGQRSGWQCLKTCPIVVRNVETNEFSLLTCKTCQTNCSLRTRTWYAHVGNFYSHIATHEGVSSDEVKDLPFQLIWERHTHLMPLTEEEVLRIDARPHVVPLLVQGELLEFSWFLKPLWTGLALRVTRGGHWDARSLERSLRVTLRAQATEPGNAIPTNHVLILHLPPNSERFRKIVTEQTRPRMNVDQANVTKPTGAEDDSTYRSASVERRFWRLSSNQDEGEGRDDNGSDASLDSDDPILGS